MKNIKTYEEYTEIGISLEEYLDNNYYFYDINVINCSGNNITSLKGSEKLINYGSLYIDYNRLTSLEGIEILTNLIELVCRNNYITSLKGVENLIKLQYLNCIWNPINWIDYIDNNGIIYYTKLPKSIIYLDSDKFKSIEKYWKFMDKNQPAGVSRKFNF